MLEPEYVYVKGVGWVAQKPKPRRFPDIMRGDLNLICNTCGERAGLHNLKGQCPNKLKSLGMYSKENTWS